MVNYYRKDVTIYSIILDHLFKFLPLIAYTFDHIA